MKVLGIGVWRIFLHLFLFIALSSSCEAAAYETIVDQATVPILTPSYSQRKTAKIRLENGLEAYVISDPRAEKSAAAMVVNVGSWEDPAEAQGMAHYVEHLLFLGTKKYPEENSFDKFLTQYGGATNAQTEATRTTFLFSVNTDVFPEALDRFASFFREPLFNPSGVDRELTAIDQEYARLARSDEARWYWVLRAVSNQEHPDARFSAGNRLSLSKVQRQEVVDWYTNHYSSHLMKLIVYSPLSLDTLKQQVVQDFQPIAKKERPSFQVNLPLFGPETRGHVSHVESIKDARDLYIVWDIPSKFAKMMDSRPGDIVCNVLGHEGDHSLLATLKEDGLAEELACMGGKIGNDQMLVGVQIKLTKAGFKGVDQVVERVLQSIQKFRERGVPRYLFDDIQGVERLFYQYQERSDAYTLVDRLAKALDDEDLSTFPQKSAFVHQYDPDAVKQLLAELTPDKMHVSVIAPASRFDRELTLHEPWGGATYSNEPISSQLLERWKNLENYPGLDIPTQNPFIARNLKQLASEVKDPVATPVPKVLVQDPFGEIYFAKDDYYQVPQTYCSFQFLTPSIDEGDHKKAALSDLYVKAAKESLKSVLYPAQMAGLTANISAEGYGLSIDLFGFDEHVPDLLKAVLVGLKQLRPTQKQFESYRETLMQSYRNFYSEPLLTQAVEVLSSVLHKDHSSPKERLRVIQHLTYQDFVSYAETLFEQNYVKGIFYGNLAEQQAKAMASTLRESIGGKPYPSKEHRVREVADLSTLAAPRFLVDSTRSTGNAIILAIESGAFSFPLYATQVILTQAMQAPFFATLRTQQQTGYAVANWQQEIERRLFLFFAVESDSHDARDLLARFELFIEGFQRDLGAAIAETEFGHIRSASVNLLERPAQDLASMGAILSTLIVDYNADFSWIQRRIDALKALSYQEFLSSGSKILGRSNHKRLAVIVKGTRNMPELMQYRWSKSVKETRKDLDYEPADHVLSQGRPPTNTTTDAK